MKAGDAASGEESRDVIRTRARVKRRWRARRKRPRKAVAAVPWQESRGSWSHEDRDEGQLVEDSCWSQYRGLAAMHEKHSAARARSTEQRADLSRRRGGKADREAVS